MKGELSIAQALKRLVGKGKSATAVALVTKVDKAAFTCDVLFEEVNLAWPGVRLKSVEDANKIAFVTFPALNSYVLLSRIEGADDWAVVACNEVSEIWLGGDSSSMVKAETLITELNKSNAALSAIMSVITTAPINEPGNGSPSALQIALNAALTGKQVGNFSSIKNENVKHG